MGGGPHLPGSSTTSATVSATTATEAKRLDHDGYDSDDTEMSSSPSSSSSSSSPAVALAARVARLHAQVNRICDDISKRVPVSTPSSPTTESREWSCAVCTFLNSITATITGTTSSSSPTPCKCSMCGALRPTPTTTSPSSSSTTTSTSLPIPSAYSSSTDATIGNDIQTPGLNEGELVALNSVRHQLLMTHTLLTQTMLLHTAPSHARSSSSSSSSMQYSPIAPSPLFPVLDGSSSSSSSAASSSSSSSGSASSSSSTPASSSSSSSASILEDLRNIALIGFVMPWLLFAIFPSLLALLILFALPYTGWCPSISNEFASSCRRLLTPCWVYVHRASSRTVLHVFHVLFITLILRRFWWLALILSPIYFLRLKVQPYVAVAHRFIHDLANH